MDTCERCDELAERLGSIEATLADVLARLEVAEIEATVGAELIRAEQNLEVVLASRQRGEFMGSAHWDRVRAQHELTACRQRAIDVFVRDKRDVLLRYVNVDDVANWLVALRPSPTFIYVREPEGRKLIAAIIRRGDFRRGLLVGDEDD